jgi:hypothetical protein
VSRYARNSGDSRVFGAGQMSKSEEHVSKRDRGTTPPGPPLRRGGIYSGEDGRSNALTLTLSQRASELGRRDVRENEKNEKVRAIGNGPARLDDSRGFSNRAGGAFGAHDGRQGPRDWTKGGVLRFFGRGREQMPGNVAFHLAVVSGQLSVVSGPLRRTGTEDRMPSPRPSPRGRGISDFGIRNLEFGEQEGVK